MTVKPKNFLGLLSTASVAAGGIDRPPDRCLSKDTGRGQAPDLRDQLISLLPRLRRFAHSLTRDNDACNDLVQETCARALAKSDLWQEGTRLDSWLFRIAQNIWLDGRRAQKARGDHVDVDEVAALAGADGRKVAEGRLLLEEVKRGLARLKPEHQVIVGLVCVDGISYKEAAEVLELPIGTVMSRLSRARIELNEVLESGVGNASRPGAESRRG